MWTQRLTPLVIAALTALPPAARAKSPVLYGFTGGQDGGGPAAALIADSTNTLYGTTCMTNADNAGTVFSLAPPATGQTAWTLRTLYQFTNVVHGYRPCGTLWRRSDGALFGTTEGGGGAAGTVFELAPPAVAGGAWTQTVIHDFIIAPSDVATPEGGLVADKRGRLFGTGVQGGTGCTGKGGCGGVFMLTPPASGTKWKETILHLFADADGTPNSNLALVNPDTIYGTTANGVFALKQGTGGVWSYTPLAISPALPAPISAGVAIGKGGVLYGVTATGGTNGTGTIFALTPPLSAGAPWTSTVLYAFGSYYQNMDGYAPAASLRVGSTGALFGTAPTGGANGAGTVFRLDPPAAEGAAWSFGLLSNLPPAAMQGANYPVGSVLLWKGATYLTTVFGGAGGSGTVLQVKQ
jgi:uncharacterized repeat protein (TIGR03803 family)